MPQNPNMPTLDLPWEMIEIYFSFHKHKNQKTAIASPLPLSWQRSEKRCLLTESNERLQLEVDDRRSGEDCFDNGLRASRGWSDARATRNFTWDLKFNKTENSLM